ncbi:OmpA family protein [Sphingobacterium sp. Mn56C]|uniref:OmpA family protein n=1 Tax=Sphingobacterium sp. Mn56C TaxID=3395261 RepID=UPI003BD37D9F
MNKKLLCVLAGVGFSLATYAQSIQVKRDTVVTEDTDKYRVVTNRFWDNWFLGAGAGAQIFFGDHAKQMKFGDRITPNYELYLGKWFSPGIGVRAGANGFKINTATQDVALSKNGKKVDKQPWDDYKLYEREFDYYHVHADVLFNLTNIFGGFREKRFYNISPYLGVGYMVTNDKPKQKEVSLNAGIFNSFRLGSAFDLTLDVRGALVNDRFDGVLGGRFGEGPLSASLGLVYKFKKRNWDKQSTTTITNSYDEAALAALISRVKQLSNDNDELRKLLANAKDTTITNINVMKNMLAAPILVTFPINKSVVSNEARVNLGFFAKLIKETNPDMVYTVTGYADKGTGTPQINERLSKERAESIFKVLVNEFGVNPAQLKVQNKGGVDNMFYNDPRLSRAVITYAEILDK